MHRTRRLAAAAVLAAGLLLLLQAPAPQSAAEGPERVIVTNFPETQRITGPVSVREPVPHSELVRRLDVIVPTVDPAATAQLAEAEVVDTTGFTHVVLGLRGEAQGTLGRDGVVGVVLIPDEEEVVRALEEEGRFEFPLEVRTEVSRAERGLFASGQPRYALGFPRYRVYLYNTADRAVSADLYLYLTN